MILRSETSLAQLLTGDTRGSALKDRESLRKWFLVAGFTLLGFLVMGYHPGLEDDAVYLPAVKAALNPSLFPFHSEFFRLQMQATVFDNAMAGFVRLTRIPVAWAELCWQLASLLVVLWACYRIASRLFEKTPERWAAVSMVSAMFTLPVSGTALFLMDQHLHPRNLATALILLAVADLLEGQRWRAVPLLGLACFLHPLMAAMGVSFCVFLLVALTDPVPRWVLAWRGSAAALVPLGWVMEPANPLWKKALDSKAYFDLYRWHWYEWVGAIAPLLLFWVLWRVALQRRETVLARFALAVFAYGVFQQLVAMVMLTPNGWTRLAPLQPMRYLQLVYFFMALAGGGLLGRLLLRKVWRWAAFLLVANGGMLWAQCAEFDGSPHLELPGRASDNPWLEAFSWIRTNTPADAYFALDPRYLEATGEDYHGFRALAERSQLADAVKDAAAVTQVPELGPEWDREVSAGAGWNRFGPADFERLKRDFGVNWVLVSLPQAAGLDCRWHNGSLAVCAIP
jgi:hypothetical protein